MAVVGITHSQTCLVLRGRLRALREAGFRVVLICSPGPLADQLAADEKAERLTVLMQRSIAPLTDLAALFRLCRVLRQLRPVLTEFSTPKAGLLGNLAAFLCRVPTRIYMLRGLRLETARGLKRMVLKATERIAAGCAHVVLCNSESLREQARELGVAREAKLRIVGHGSSNGVDTQHYSPGPDCVRTRLGIARDAPVIGFVGRLTRDKGIPELIEAFEKLLERTPAARLLLVGWFDRSEDALSPELRGHIDAHPAIVRTGLVEDAAPYYRAMNMLVLPTWREGFPNAALEAAASAIPVITTLTTGARDAVIPGVTGLLIPPGDPLATLASMQQLLGSAAQRLTMGLAGRRWVVGQFAKRQVLGQTVAFYRDLLGGAEMRAKR
ncbi:MAG TPA: glycosyltransferase family 4 protein [Terracidiphilus sp.]